MNRKNFVTLLFILLSITLGFAQKTTIKTTLINNKFTTVELLSASNKDLPALAKADIKNDQFTLVADIASTDLFFLKFTDKDAFLLCIAPKENVELTLDANNLRQIISVKGSSSMPLTKEITDIMLSKQNCLDSINRLLQQDKTQLSLSGFNLQFTKYHQANQEWDSDITSAIAMNDSLLQLTNLYASNGQVDKKNTELFLISSIKYFKLLKNYCGSFINYTNNIAATMQFPSHSADIKANIIQNIQEYKEIDAAHTKWVTTFMQEYAGKIETLVNEYDDLFYGNQLESNKAKNEFSKKVLNLIKDYTPKIAENKANYADLSTKTKNLAAQITNDVQAHIQLIVAQYQATYENENRKQNVTLHDLMIQNKTNLATLMFLDNFAQDKALQTEILTALNEVYPTHPIVSERYKAINTPQYKTSEGSIAPELAFEGVDGKIRKLSDLRGKVVLVDFWASWCGPCRRENPHVVSMYAKYHDKGFEVFSVSLDKNKQSWIDAIAKDNLSWPNHVSDLKYWSSEAAKIYGVNSIPSTFLLDKEGRIIAKNLRGEALTNALKQIFGE